MDSILREIKFDRIDWMFFVQEYFPDEIIPT